MTAVMLLKAKSKMLLKPSWAVDSPYTNALSETLYEDIFL